MCLIHPRSGEGVVSVPCTRPDVRATPGLYRESFPAATFGTDQWEVGKLPADRGR